MTARAQGRRARDERRDVLYINGKFVAQPMTGVQRYAKHILETIDTMLAEGSWIAHRRLVVVTPDTVRSEPVSYRHLETRAIPAKHLHAWEQMQLPLATRGAMVLNLAGSAPLLKFGQICTFHDTAVFDVPNAYSPMFARWYRLLFSVQGKLSRRLLTVSEFSKERICHHLGVAPEKVGVVHSAADHMALQIPDEGVLERLNVQPNGYLLAVGSANPTKNFARLIEAFCGLPRDDIRLVVVGGGNSAVFAANDAAAQDDPRIIRAGRLSDAELKTLYSYARAYVFPSIYEGFGLPPIEAMLCGCPVIAARAASIPEICGPAAGYFDPRSLASMREAMTRAIDDDTWLRGLAIAGHERAKLYSWSNAATGLMRQLALLGIVRQADGVDD